MRMSDWSSDVCSSDLQRYLLYRSGIRYDFRMSEADFIARLRAIATDPAARGLADDAAVLGDLVLTHDMIVEGVHFLPDERPQDVAWKLAAVNLSDLAAKGAAPLGVLVGYSQIGRASCRERVCQYV